MDALLKRIQSVVTYMGAQAESLLARPDGGRSMIEAQCKPIIKQIEAIKFMDHTNGTDVIVMLQTSELWAEEDIQSMTESIDHAVDRGDNPAHMHLNNAQLLQSCPTFPHRYLTIDYIDDCVDPANSTDDKLGRVVTRAFAVDLRTMSCQTKRSILATFLEHFLSLIHI